MQLAHYEDIDVYNENLFEAIVDKIITENFNYLDSFRVGHSFIILVSLNERFKVF